MASNMNQSLVMPAGFDYAALDKGVADRVRRAADRIRSNVRKTLQEIIEIGNHLLEVKHVLPHGRFLPWLVAEFDWAERTARNFMAVAEVFGPKSALIADLAIQPTAAYLLAAPAVPDQARLEAIEMAEAGEQITVEMARSIVSSVKQRDRKRPRGTDTQPQLLRTLERYRDGWAAGNIREFIRILRLVADETEHAASGTRKGR